MKNLFSLFVLLVLTVVPSFAVKADVNGQLNTDLSVIYDEDFTPHYVPTHDLEVGLNIPFDEAVSVKLTLEAQSQKTFISGTDTFSTIVRPRDQYIRTALNRGQITESESDWPASENLKFPSPYLYQILFNWEFTEGGSLLFGDLIYSAGGTSYYGFRHPQYASIVQETSLRGFGFHASDLKFYIGSTDRNFNSLATFISYAVPLLERRNLKLMVRPLADLVLHGGGRKHNYTLGTEYEFSHSLSKINYGIKGAAGLIPYENDEVYTLLAEPSVNLTKDFSMGFIAYHAFLVDPKISAALQTDVPEQSFYVFEPSLALTEKSAIGLPIEYHDPLVDLDKDEYWQVTPTVYFYPNAYMNLDIWTSITVQDRVRKAEKELDYSIGMETLIKF
jgi:hypothetical protein